MTSERHAPDAVAALPALIDRAALALTNARSSAEVLEAREMAGFAYDAAKRAGRLAKAKQAHDDLIGAAYRAQAHALEIESQAKSRLADEYDAAQERGEVARQGQRTDLIPDGKKVPTPADIGLTPKQVHEARIVRDAERNDPGIVKRALDEIVERHEEPTKAALRQVVTQAAGRSSAASKTVPAFSISPPDRLVADVTHAIAARDAAALRSAAAALMELADEIDPPAAAEPSGLAEAGTLFQLEPVSPLSRDRSQSRSAKAQTDELQREFLEEVWPQYPLKKGRKDAMAAYVRARSLGAAKVDILQGVIRFNSQCAVQQTAPRFIMGGERFFNGEHWTDEFDLSPATAKPNLSRVQSALEGLATYGK